MPQFTGLIYLLGINPVIDPPQEVVDMLLGHAQRSRGPIPVCGTANGAPFIQTLVKFRGAWRLYMNAEMLRASELKVGDHAQIDISFDAGPRTVPMPEALRKALDDNDAARRQFEQLAPSRRKEILQYLNSLRSPAAVARNVDKIISRFS